MIKQRQKTAYNSDSCMVKVQITSPLNQTTPYGCRRLAGALGTVQPYTELFEILGRKTEYLNTKAK